MTIRELAKAKQDGWPMCGLPRQGSTEKTILLWKSLVGVYTCGTLLQLYRYTTFLGASNGIYAEKTQ